MSRWVDVFYVEKKHPLSIVPKHKRAEAVGEGGMCVTLQAKCWSVPKRDVFDTEQIVGSTAVVKAVDPSPRNMLWSTQRRKQGLLADDASGRARKQWVNNVARRCRPLLNKLASVLETTK